MTIAALLSHHGIEVPRYVTVDGQVVFDDVSVRTSGPTHATLGAVTPVPRHTFHGGGEEPGDDVHLPAWWEVDDRLARHVSAMRECFPNFVYLEPEGDQAPCWAGPINTGRGTFRIAIFLRRDGGLPTVARFGAKLGRNSGRRWVASPHLFLNGNLCIAAQDDWQVDARTAATATAWAAHWLAAYTEWRITGRWPVAGAARDAA